MGRFKASQRLAQAGANPGKKAIAAFHPSVTGGNRSSSATGRVGQSIASKLKKGITKVGNSIASKVNKHAESLNNIGKSVGSEAQSSLKQQLGSMPSQIKGSLGRTSEALKSKAYQKLDKAARHVVTVNSNMATREAYRNPQRAQPIKDQHPYPMAQAHAISGSGGGGKRKATATAAAPPAKKAHLPTSRPSNPHVSAGALQQAKSQLRQTATKKSAAEARAVGRKLNNQVRRKRIAASGGSHNRKRLGATKLGKMD